MKRSPLKRKTPLRGRAKCLARNSDDDGRMFYCELPHGHSGKCDRKIKLGYKRKVGAAERRIREAIGAVSPKRKSKYKRRPRALAYMQWVKTLHCAAVTWSGLCDGPIEADHAGLRAVGRKAPDSTCIPLCRAHHRMRHDFSGSFLTWSKTEMREWLDKVITETQASARHMGIEIPSC